MVDSNFKLGEAVSGKGSQLRVSVVDGRSSEKDFVGENDSINAARFEVSPISVREGEEGRLIPSGPTKADLYSLSNFGDLVGQEFHKTQVLLGKKPITENDFGRPKHLSPTGQNYESNPVINSLFSSTSPCKRGGKHDIPARAQSWKRRARELKESQKLSPLSHSKEKKKRKGNVELVSGDVQKEPISEKNLRLDYDSQGIGRGLEVCFTSPSFGPSYYLLFLGVVCKAASPTARYRRRTVGFSEFDLGDLYLLLLDGALPPNPVSDKGCCYAFSSISLNWQRLFSTKNGVRISENVNYSERFVPSSSGRSRATDLKSPKQFETRNTKRRSDGILFRHDAVPKIRCIDFGTPFAGFKQTSAFASNATQRSAGIHTAWTKL
ncbi:hypothetical protein U1Q18_049997 [Sarracenia purpurea var. burkii]